MKALLLPVLLLLSAGVFSQTYTPAVKLTEGKKYVVATVTKGNIAQEVMGQTMEMPMDVTSTSMLEVKKVNGQEFQLSNTLERLVMGMNIMGQEMNYDSDKKEDRESEMGKSVSGQIGKPTTFIINDYGKVKEGSIVKTTSPEKEAPGANMLMNMVNTNEANQTSEAVNMFISNAALKVGDSYSDSSSANGGKDKTRFTYTLQEVKDGAAKFSIAGESVMSKEMEAQGMQAVTNTTIKTTGEMWVSLNTGLLIKKVINAVISGSVDVAGMNIPMSGTQATTTTVTEAVATNQ